MGGCASFPVYDDVKIKKYQTQFEALQLTSNDVGRLLKIFRQVDCDRGGAVGLAELLVHINLDQSTFTESVFTMFDADGSGELDFREFVCSLWNYCTLNRQTLDLFAFDLYDADKSGVLSVVEIGHMLSDIYGENYKKDFRTKALMSEIHDMHAREVVCLSMAEFCKFAKTHQALLFPAFEMQRALQQYTMGIGFWEKVSNRRSELSSGEYVQVDEFVKMYIKTGLHSVPKKSGEEEEDPRAKDPNYTVVNNPNELRVVRKKPKRKVVTADMLAAGYDPDDPEPGKKDIYMSAAGGGGHRQMKERKHTHIDVDPLSIEAPQQQHHDETRVEHKHGEHHSHHENHKHRNTLQIATSPTSADGHHHHEHHEHRHSDPHGSKHGGHGHHHHGEDALSPHHHSHVASPTDNKIIKYAGVTDIKKKPGAHSSVVSSPLSAGHNKVHAGRHKTEVELHTHTLT